ncbi:MAG: alpha/beta fold hydrolase [Chitinispirillaceae bacterium]|nr:alpha/beta fold hydrolase [Chitinispirillaceae bacterium]
MNSTWTVLGGWGISPDILRPVFGPQSTYIDVNELAARICSNGLLAADWKLQLSDHLQPHLHDTRFLAGWSTGAILALGCAPLLSLDGLALISATPSFCRTGNYPFGIRSRMLHAMRAKLATDTATVLDDFRQQCGLVSDLPTDIPWTPAALQAGLDLLEFITLDTVDTLPCEPLLIHGTRDTVIPVAAGNFLHQTLGGTMLHLDAPHACFTGNESAITTQIETYLQRNTP